MKMAKNIAKWRESASLIILSKDEMTSNDGSNFKTLLFSRSEKSSFMPTISVFPGGVCEKEDESRLWLKHFQNIGIREDHLQSLILERSPKLHPQPSIFKTKEKDSIHRDISLRITAIRETFEEIGVMFCRDRKCLFEENNGFGFYREDFDRLHWQERVHNDASEFLNLCKMLDVVPDLWSLTEWSVWQTPATLKKRFETVFYMITLENIADVILDAHEAAHYKWMTPKEALILNMAGTINLAAPQFTELSRLLNFEEINAVQEYAEKRAKNGSILMLPVHRLCIDGLVALLPGDSNYPNEPNSESTETSIDLTRKQYRENAEKVHRFEFESLIHGTFYNNFEPLDGHMKPINLSNSSKL